MRLLARPLMLGCPKTVLVPESGSMMSRIIRIVIAAFCGSVFLLFLVAPIARLIGAGGAQGVQHLFSDGELRSALALTAMTATSATALAILGGTPLAYVLERRPVSYTHLTLPTN